jgi:alpha-mannosidase
MWRPFVLSLAVLPLAAAPSLLWHIGTPNRSYGEFRGARDAVYRIGTDTASAWPREHAIGSHPSIRFQLAQPPAGSYELRLHLLFRTTAIPVLHLDVNGRGGNFIPAPQQTDPVNDYDGNYIPHFYRQTLPVALPASFLRQGSNEIRITLSGAGALFYDAIEFLHDPAAAPPACPVSARLVPTVFWQRENGALVERVDLIARLACSQSPARVEILVAGRRYERSAPAGYVFGDLVFPLQVPDLGAGADATIHIAAGAARLQSTTHLVPARKWKLYVASTTHLDIGYTAPQADALNTHLDNAALALDLIDRYPEFRWNLEGSWLVDRFLAQRGDAASARLTRAASQGTLGVNALHSNLQASLVSLEEWNRATEAGHDFGRRAGAPMDFASISDVPSLPWEMPTVLSQAGVSYLANGANQVRGPVVMYGHLDQKSPFYWTGPDGSRVLCWFTVAYGHVGFLFGIPATFEQARAGVEHYLESYPASYPSDAVLIYGFDGDNAPLRAEGNAGFYRQWNQIYEYPRIVPARYRDFFSYVENQCSTRLPVLRGDGGAHWEDGAGECPRATALNRRNQAQAVEVETLASLAVIRDPGLRFPESELRSIWNDILLFDEHTFGRDGSPSRPESADVREQWAVKRGYAERAAIDLDWAHREWLSRLTGSRGKAVAVWNPSSWARSDVVEMEVPTGQAPAGVPFEVLSDTGGLRTIRFLARDVPPLGVRSYPLIAASAPAVLPATGGVIENQAYRVTVDASRPGIPSIVDKATGRELIDSGSPYALGEFLRVIETSSRRTLTSKGSWDTAVRTRLDHNSTDLPVPVLEIQRARVTAPPRIRRTAAGSSVILTGSAPGVPRVEFEVRLWDGIPRIDFIARMRKPAASGEIAEALYFAFPFHAAPPVFSYDRALGWVNPARDMLPGSAPEWFAATNAVNVAAAGASFTLATPDTPLVTFGDVVRGRWPRTFAPPARGTVFSYVYNNYWLTNFPAGQEGGDFEWRYSLSTAPAARGRIGEEVRHPFSAVLAPPAAPGPAPIEIDSTHVRLVTLRRAPQGDGYLIRLAEDSGQRGEARVRLPGLKVRSAHLASTHGESHTALPLDGGVVRVPLAPYGQATLLLR